MSPAGSISAPFERSTRHGTCFTTPTVRSQAGRAGAGTSRIRRGRALREWWRSSLVCRQGQRFVRDPLGRRPLRPVLTFTQIGSGWYYGPNLDTDRDGKADDLTTLRRNWANGLTLLGNNLRSYLPGKIVGGNGNWYRPQDYTGPIRTVGSRAPITRSSSTCRTTRGTRPTRCFRRRGAGSTTRTRSGCPGIWPSSWTRWTRMETSSRESRIPTIRRSCFAPTS